jgi:A/G-specific adenine glycosylase
MAGSAITTSLNRDSVTAGQLLDWYASAGRDLPWRHTRDPYAILVSEVMLQQTQVARVVDRYRAWLERWPSADALAEATVGDAVAAWNGLGYNRRAVSLHTAAVIVARDGWPRTTAGLQRLPGVGPYTAAAVACLAFGEPVMPLDVNIHRVLERTGADVEPRPEVVQALFDLGATVCLGRRPRCGVCPLEASCPSAGMTFAPARRQGPFTGSRRQARGELLRRVIAGPVPVEDADATIAAALVKDHLVAITDGVITLAP